MKWNAGLADLLLARTRRLAIASGEARNADAIIRASNPSTVCSISGARMLGRQPDALQANISARRRSGISPPAAAASRPSAMMCKCRPLPRRASPPRCIDDMWRATVSSQASGFAGQPRRGQSASAAANASASASSAAVTSVRSGKEGDQLAIAPARNGVGRAQCLASPSSYGIAYAAIGQTGRTSTTP